MVSLENLKYSVRNLLARKSRSFLTILSILVGITTIFIFISFGLGLLAYVNDLSSEAGADKIMVTGKSSGAPGLDQAFKLTDVDLNVIEKTKGVSEVAEFYMSVVKINQDTDFKYVFAISMSGDPIDASLMSEFVNGDMVGRDLTEDDLGKVVLGYNYMLPDKILPEPYELGDKIEIAGRKFKIIGFYAKIGNPQDDSNIFMLHQDLLSFEGNEDLGYGQFFIRAEDVDDIDATVERLEKRLRKSRGVSEGSEDFNVQSFAEAIEMFTNVLNIIVGFIVLIALISVVVSAVNTANTMITSVLERIQEIGIIKSIGATNSEIFSIFLVESMILGGTAGIIGIGFGYLFTSVAAVMLDNLGWGFLMPLYTPSLFIGCFLFAVLVGTLSGVIPAVNASRQKPVDALRYE